MCSLPFYSFRLHFSYIYILFRRQNWIMTLLFFFQLFRKEKCFRACAFLIALCAKLCGKQSLKMKKKQQFCFYSFSMKKNLTQIRISCTHTLTGYNEWKTTRKLLVWVTWKECKLISHSKHSLRRAKKDAFGKISKKKNTTTFFWAAWP